MFERLTIVGDGLIGRSCRLAFERRYPDARVTSLDRTDDLRPLESADGVLLAAPVGAILGLLPVVAARPTAASLVMDVGSTKRSIVRTARAVRLDTFVGGHPMAGGTATGPSAASADLFDGRPWFLVTGGAAEAAVDRARSLVRALGGHPIEMPDEGEEHDRLVAAISHLPQVVATALLAIVGEQVGHDGLRYAGAGLRDTTRIAAGSPDVWRSILSSNRDALAPLLKSLASVLAVAADQLDDSSAIDRLFARSHRWLKHPPRS
jgi:prephenate dehydrogenase